MVILLLYQIRIIIYEPICKKNSYVTKSIKNVSLLRVLNLIVQNLFLFSQADWVLETLNTEKMTIEL
jgi:hypothetical protein